MTSFTPGRLAAPAALVLLALAVHAPALPGLLNMLACDGPIRASDAFTHLVRIVHAADFYLPSGHHWGWDPFWFQGYVPFALYPHLHYVTLAVSSKIFGIAPVDLFNWATVISLFLPPLLAGLLAYRSHGPVVATLTVVWIGSVNSAYGAGLRGLFGYGLFSQQFGLIVFTLFAYELLMARRERRAAMWLGVAGLVHLHAAIVSGLLWGGLGLLRLIFEPARREWLPAWCKATAMALLLMAPTVVGLVVARHQIGPSTFFNTSSVLQTLLRGNLVAPWPMVLAVVGAAVAGLAWGSAPVISRAVAPDTADGASACAFVRPPAGLRENIHIALAVVLGLAVAVLGVIEVRIGVHLIDRVLRGVMFLRSLPCTFIWLAMLGAIGWASFDIKTKSAVVAFTLLGTVIGWSHEYGALLRLRCDTIVSETQTARSTYPELLDWIDEDRDEAKTYTMLLVTPHPRKVFGRALQRLTLRLRQPVLGGHGVELTSVRNLVLANRSASKDCGYIKRELKRSAVGYVMGASPAARQHFGECLEASPDWENRWWWVFKTGHDWTSFAPRIERFSHDATWTRLEWDLLPASASRKLHLPMAHTAPWSASADGKPVALEKAPGGLMRLIVPAGSEQLRLIYVGYPGEWISVAVSVLALAWFLLSGRGGARGPTSASGGARGLISASGGASSVSRTRNAHEDGAPGAASDKAEA